MNKMKRWLLELLREKKLRVEARTRSLVDQGPVLKKEGRGSWKKKRDRWTKYYSEHSDLEAPAGELANMIDGLTPDGYDKEGRKVSFIEQGEDLIESPRISSGRPIYINKR